MMLIFAFLTLGYFAGVITALLIFPPKTTELEMQEKDALKPINDLIQSGESHVSVTNFSDSGSSRTSQVFG
jgi:hypothetical protein